MNRSKLFIGIFIAFILIVITIVLLACTVFVVRSVSVESEVASDVINEDKIIESSGISLGRSIISISKEKALTSIEKANPYVEVLSITRVFPNKIIIKATERRGVMLVSSLTGEEYALVDSSLKVLNVAASAESLSTTATVVSGVYFNAPESGVETLIGSKLILDKTICADIIAEIADCAAFYNFRAERFSAIFKQITFIEQEGVITVFVRTVKGVTFVLDKSLTSDVYDQLAVCLNYYTTDQEVNIDYTRGYIYFNREKNGFEWAEAID